MKFFKLIPHYFSWHYSTALADLISFWENYLWFILNYFSIKLILRTLFKPYRHLTELTRTQDNKKELKIVTALAGIFGSVIRVVTVVVGILTFLLAFSLGLFIFLLWLILPFFILLIFLVSIGVIFKP
jgi:uncharacterized membrane protein